MKMKMKKRVKMKMRRRMNLALGRMNHQEKRINNQRFKQ